MKSSISLLLGNVSSLKNYFHKRKFVALAGLVFLLLFFSLRSNAQLLLTEQFNYTVSATDGLNKQSGSLWANFNTGDSILVSSGSLSYNGLETSVGNSVTFGGTGTDCYRAFSSQTSGTVYASFLLNVTSLGSLNTTGGYSFGFLDNGTSNFAGRVWMRLSGTTNFNIGINTGSITANTSWASNALSTNTTYLVVISLQFVSGTSNDIAKIWINPAIGSGEPSASGSSTNLTGTDPTSIQRFFLRQDATTSTPTLIFDELRVGTTWAAVTPSGVYSPSVSTTTASSITSTSATAGGNVTNEGTSSVTARGLAYGTSVNPTTGTSDGTGAGSFTSTLNGLSVNTRYYYRAYATSSVGTGYGTESNFWTLANTPSLVTVGNATLTSLDVALGTGDGNPAGTAYAIQDSVSGQYIQTDGTLGASAFYKTSWSTVTVTGLFQGSNYYFRAKARNGNNTETSFSISTLGTTLAPSTPTISASMPANDFGNVCLSVPSSALSFTFSGSALDGTNVTITGPSSVFGFSTSLSGTYSSSLSFAGYGTSISLTTVYVKFTPSAQGQEFGDILISGGGIASSIALGIIGNGINDAPVISAPSSASLAAASATLGGNITSIGCSNVSERGVFVSTLNGFADGAGTKVSEAGSFSTGTFAVSATGLTDGTVYYFKAFATNNGGTVYTSQGTFTTTAIGAPVAAAASSVIDTSFTANWSEVTGATGYRLDVGTTQYFSDPTVTTDLIISEYLEGSSNNKYVEVYNGTGAPVNLSNYQLILYANGGTSASNTVTLSGTLANGAVKVYRNSGATLYNGADTATNAATNFNGDDAVALYKISTSSYVDIFGRIGEDPGTGWTSGSFSTLDKTLVRKPTVLSGVTVNPSSGFPTLSTEWDQYNTDVISNLGSHTITSRPASGLAGYLDLPVTGTSQVVTGLTQGTDYYYRVRAVSPNTTSANSNIINVRTKTNQTITFNALSAKTYGDAPFTLNGTASSGLSLSYSSSDSAVATISGNTVTITGGGTVTITAAQAGNATYMPAANVSRTLTVNKANQTISFNALDPKLDNDPAFTLSATASSGLAVSYSSSNTSVATVSGNTVTIVGAGTTTITASQTGDVNYNAAASVDRSLVVTSSSALDQTISFGSLSPVTYGDAPFQLTATATSGLTVSYVSSNTSVATVSGDVVTVVGPGTAEITASQSGGSGYNAAPNVIQTLTVNKKTLTVSGAVAQNKVYNGSTAAIIDLTSATLNGVVGADVVTVSGGGTFADFHAGTGIAVTTSLVLGGANASKYLLTQPSGLVADITQASQTITFTSIPVKTYTPTLQKFKLVASASSGLPVTFSSGNTAVATVDGDSATVIAAGSCLITASQAGNGDYLPASNVDSPLTVNKATQFITFSTIPPKTTADAPFFVSAYASSGLPVSFSSSNTAVATVVDSAVTITGIGTTNITASQAGNSNYLPANNNVKVLNVTAPILMAWNFYGFGSSSLPTFGATNVAAGVDSASGRKNVTRGIAAAYSAAANSFRTVGFKNNGINLDSLDYFQITIKPSSGKKLNINNILANFAGTTSFAATPGVSSQFAYSLNGTTFTAIGSPTVTTGTPANVLIDASGISALQNIPSSTTVTIRYFASGQTTTGGWGFTSANAETNGLAIGGTVETVPVPVISSASTASGTVGTSFTYSITASNSPTSYSASGLPSGLTLNGSTGVISGTPTVAGTFNATINAINEGGTGSANLEITVAQGSQTITFNALPSKVYGNAPFTLNGSASSGLTVSYSSSNTAVATVSGNTVTIVGAGSTTITASQAGDANWAAAASVDQSLVVSKGNQTISFGALADKLDTDAPFTLSGSASSGLTVQYSSSNTAVATVSGDVVTIVGSGTTTITASQGGNDNYNAASDVAQNLTVINTSLQNQTITFGALSNRTYGDASFNLTATASSSLAVTYASSNTSVATVSGDVVTIVAPGTTTITASQAGGSGYNAAPDVAQSLTVIKKTLTVSGAVAQSKVYDGNTAASIDLTVATLNGVVGADVVGITGTSGTFASSNAGTGISVTTSISLNGSNADRYLIAQPTGLTADITKANQTITFGALPNKTTASAAFALNGTSSSGLTVSYSSSNTSVATVSGNTVTIVGAGTTTITASQSGNGNYNAASNVDQSLTVTQAPVNATWTFGATSADSTSFPVGGANAISGITISRMGRSNNNGTTTLLTTTSTSGTSYTGSSAGENAGAAIRNNGFDKDTSTYFSFTLSPNAFKKLTLSGFSFGSRGTSSGPRVYSLRSSADNYASSIATDSMLANSTWALKTATLASNPVSGYGQPITFRLYGYGNNGLASPNTANWRIDDVTISVLLETAPDCSGTPTAGTASAASTSLACGNSGTTLTLNGHTDPSSNQGIELQWYSSADNINFAPVAGATSATISTGSLSAAAYYYCRVSCSASNLYANSNTVSLSVAPCSTTLHLKLYAQGLYDASSGLMSAKLFNNGVAGASSNDVDTVVVELRDPTTGALLTSAVKAVLHTNGTLDAVFPSLTGTAYTAIRGHVINGPIPGTVAGSSIIETWSADPLLLSESVSYDFTTSASKAYGSNQLHLGGGVYGIYNGDLNQDGSIEAADYSQMENDVLAILFGYYNSDLTGDGVVEAADYSLMENNVLSIIFSAKPF